MPIYEYKCENGHLFDVMQRMSDDALKECIECGAPVRKVMQPVGISFKGSGFYSTDYSAKGKEVPPSNSNSSSKGENDSSSSNGSKSQDSSNGSKSTDSSEKSGGASKSGDSSGATKTPDKG